MRLSQDIKSISYVKANTATVPEQANASGPVIITRNGEASAVFARLRKRIRNEEDSDNG